MLREDPTLRLCLPELPGLLRHGVADPRGKAGEKPQVLGLPLLQPRNDRLVVGNDMADLLESLLVGERHSLAGNDPQPAGAGPPALVDQLLARLDAALQLAD